MLAYFSIVVDGIDENVGINAVNNIENNEIFIILKILMMVVGSGATSSTTLMQMLNCSKSEQFLS